MLNFDDKHCEPVLKKENTLGGNKFVSCVKDEECQSESTYLFSHHCFHGFTTVQKIVKVSVRFEKFGGVQIKLCV